MDGCAQLGPDNDEGFVANYMLNVGLFVTIDGRT